MSRKIYVKVDMSTGTNRYLFFESDYDDVSMLPDGYFDATETLKGYTTDDYPYVVFENEKAVYKPELKEKELEEEKRLEEELLAKEKEEEAESIIQTAFMQSETMLRSALPFVQDEDIKTIGDRIPLWSDKAIPYEKGEVVKYNEGFYRVSQSHTSQANWAPDKAVSLFYRVGNPAEEYPEWIQPTGAHNAYAIGDKVKYQGKNWVSTANANVWAPGVHGWEVVI